MFWFSIELTSVTNTSGEGIDHHDHLKIPPSREFCKYSATESSAPSVSAGSGPAPGSAPTDPQTPAEISEGSTKPLLHVHVGFLWENVPTKCHPRVVCAPLGQQYDASFNQNTCRKALKHTVHFSPMHMVYICWEMGKIPLHCNLIDQILFSDLFDNLYCQQLQRLLFGNKILMKRLFETQRPM